MKNKSTRPQIILFLLIFITTGVLAYIVSNYSSSNSDARDYPQIQQEGVIRIVTNPNPVGYFASSDTIAGYNYDLLLAMQQFTNLKFEILVENNLDASFDGLESGKYDIVARHIAVNTELKEKYLFTKSALNNKLVLVQRKPEYNDTIQAIRKHLDLAKKTIHVPHESPSILRIKNLSHEIGDTIFVIENDVYDTNQLVLMVAAGEIDYTVCDIKTAEKLAKKIPELDIKTDIGFTHLESWAVRKTSPILLDSINSWFDKIKHSKEYQRIQKRYL